MGIDKCPGQDPRPLKPGDVHDVNCPTCGKSVEPFKDDMSRKCPSCGTRFGNPNRDMGCAKWCKFASECIDFINASEAADSE